MNYNPGDRVKIVVAQGEGNDHIEKGTKGTVTQSVPAGDAYWVRFDGRKSDLLVPGNVLAPA